MSPQTKAMRVCWRGTADPLPGQWLASKGGRSLYHIEGVSVLHRARLSSQPRLRLTVTPRRVIDLTPEEMPATPLPWALTTTPGIEDARAERIRIRSANANEQASQRSRAVTAKSVIEPVLKARGEVDPADWIDRDKTAIRGYRRSCPLRRAYRSGASEIGVDHIRAADIVRAHYDAATLGLSPGGVGLKPGHVHTQRAPSMGPGAGALAQQRAVREYRRALLRIGSSRTALFLWVVIGNRDLASWASAESVRLERVVDRKRETGKLIALLDDLVEHYASELRESAARGEDAA